MANERGIKKRRLIHHIATGGTIGSGMTENARQTDSEAQKKNLGTLVSIPHTDYQSIDVLMGGDSSEHPRSHLIDLAKRTVAYADEGHGMVIEHGTDTMNIAAATLALAGNESWKYPVVFLGSMKGPDVEGSDAPINILTAGYFAAFGNASGVLAVRPNGKIITSRHDTPGGSVDWHGRGIQQAPDAYFAQIDLEKLLTTINDYKHHNETSMDRNIKERLAGLYKHVKDPTHEQIAQVYESAKRSARTNFPYSIRNFESIIEYQRRVNDGTLDTADAIVVGGRGRVPTMSILGLSREHITEFKDKSIRQDYSKIVENIYDVIKFQDKRDRIVGTIIQPLALIDNIQKSSLLRKEGKVEWDKVMSQYLNKIGFSVGDHTNSIIDFWEKYSGKPNTDFNFNDIISIDGSSDPTWFYSAVEKNPPKGVIIKATGASGLRLREGSGDNYLALLKGLKDSNIPTVLTSGSRGEVTSLEYGPGFELYESDLCFFAGTMDSDLVQPRIALLNSFENRKFISELVDLHPEKDIERNMYRQLLSGIHYRKPHEGETPDRKRIEDKYGIETRVDLLSGMHAKKAILGAYLHTVLQSGMKVSENLPNILTRN